MDGQRKNELKGKKSVLLLEIPSLMVSIFKDALQGLPVEVSVIEGGIEGLSRLNC